MFKKALIGLVLFVSVVFLVAGPAPAAQEGPAGNLMFILDASGSMWGRMEGKAKIAIAKEVMIDLVQGLPDGLNVGLVAYGHRRKGDCNDVEELVGLAPLDKAGIIKKIQALQPKGKTPITLSVRLTAQKLKDLEEETTIILVSDGKETCQGDPCALVRELKEAGLKFVMHVIGFGVTEQQKKQLECIAQAGGGQYFSAQNAGEFQMAAQKAVKKTQDFGVLSITATKNDKPLHAWVEITAAETKQALPTETTSGETGSRKIQLPPGTYDVSVRDSETVSGGDRPPVKFSGVVIELGQTVEKRADFSDGTLVLKAVKNDKPFEAKVAYFRSGEKKSFHNEMTNPKTGQVRRKFVPGTYDLLVYDFHTAGSPSISLKGVEIPAGQTIEKTAEFASGSLKILTTMNNKPVNSPVEILNPAGQKVSNFWTQQGERTVQLLQGTYDLKVTLLDIPGGNPVVWLRGVEIKAGQTDERAADFKIGFLKVSATLEGKPFNTPVKLFKENSQSNIGHWTSGGTRTFPLAPGVYDLEVVSVKDNKQSKAFKGIRIEAGRTESISVAFPLAVKQ